MNRNLRHQRRLAGMADIIHDMRGGDSQRSLARPPSRAINRSSLINPSVISRDFLYPEELLRRNPSPLREEDYAEIPPLEEVFENRQVRYNGLDSSRSSLYLREIESHRLISSAELEHTYDTMED